MNCKRCGMAPRHNQGSAHCRGCGDSLTVHTLVLDYDEYYAIAQAINMMTTNEGHAMIVKQFPQMDQAQWVETVESVIEKLFQARPL